MAPDARLIARLDELIALFNRKSLDLPDGLFDRRTQFLLNGTPFESMLGRPAADPLVLMIARGPAGYRFALKALQHAMPDAQLARDGVEPGEGTVPGEWAITLRLTGHLRDTGTPVDAAAAALIHAEPTGVVTRAGVTIDPGVLDQLREARLRP